jgi:hypothetical protein
MTDLDTDVEDRTHTEPDRLFDELHIELVDQGADQELDLLA